jgi:hypothetical protein
MIVHFLIPELKENALFFRRLHDPLLGQVRAYKSGHHCEVQRDGAILAEGYSARRLFRINPIRRQFRLECLDWSSLDLLELFVDVLSSESNLASNRYVADRVQVLIKRRAPV